MLFHIKFIKFFSNRVEEDKNLFLPLISLIFKIPFIQLFTLFSYSSLKNQNMIKINFNEINFNHTNWIELYETYNTVQILGFLFIIFILFIYY